MLYRLQNPIQNYAWGSTTALTKLFGISNESGEPQAEIWMGAHPNGCSAINTDGNELLLSDLISNNPEKVLGERVCRTFGELPYLLKILAADKPLSIQVHPEKSRAGAGFARENQLGIALNSSQRNYKDANHKPELVYALTPYLAMNAFRPIAEIIDLFEQSGCTTLAEPVADLKANPDASHLRDFFRFILTLAGEQKQDALKQLLTNITEKGSSVVYRQAFATIAMLAEHYPGDVGLFSPLLLNVIELAPGEAMFLDAETPHAYLHGTGVEIMANSDNVLRAGLTPKHMDVEELIANTRFVPIPASELLTRPEHDGNVSRFPVPVNDFKFEIITLPPSDATERQSIFVDSAEIVLCIAGSVNVHGPDGQLTLAASESAFVEACTLQYQLSGCGQLVRITV